MKNILLIDDDKYIRDVYNEVLLEAGYNVDVAADGKAGLEKIISGGYDLILLDIMMPYLDGIGLLSKLKEQKTRESNGPIVVLTNLTGEQIETEAEENGAYLFLNKSDLNPDELLLKVKEILNKTN